MRPHFKLIDGSGERIALSLVHARGRVDIPSRVVVSIEVLTQSTFLLDDGQSLTVDNIHVAVTFEPSVGLRIGKLTSRIVGEPMRIEVDSEVIATPIVREPLWTSSFAISALSLGDAEALAQRMRAGWRRPNLRVVSCTKP